MTSRQLGDALDHAEATIPSLHRSRSHFETKRTSRMQAYGRPHLLPNSSGDQSSFDLVWCPPRHRAVAAYWRALKASIRLPYDLEDDLRAYRKAFKDAREIYENKTSYRYHPNLVHSPAVSLRAILNARAAMVEAFMILDHVEAQANYWRQIEANKKAVERDARLRRSNPMAYSRRRQKRRAA